MPQNKWCVIIKLRKFTYSRFSSSVAFNLCTDGYIHVCVSRCNGWWDAHVKYVTAYAVVNAYRTV